MSLIWCMCLCLIFLIFLLIFKKVLLYKNVNFVPPHCRLIGLEMHHMTICYAIVRGGYGGDGGEEDSSHMVQPFWVLRFYHRVWVEHRLSPSHTSRLLSTYLTNPHACRASKVCSQSLFSSLCVRVSRLQFNSNQELGFPDF